MAERNTVYSFQLYGDQLKFMNDYFFGKGEETQFYGGYESDDAETYSEEEFGEFGAFSGVIGGDVEKQNISDMASDMDALDNDESVFLIAEEAINDVNDAVDDGEIFNIETEI